MTKFENPSFSVGLGDTKAYRDNWERIFGKNSKKDLLPPRDAQPAPVESQLECDDACTEDRCGPNEDGEYGTAPLAKIVKKRPKKIKKKTPNEKTKSKKTKSRQ